MYINIICHLGNLRYDIKDNHLMTKKLYKKIESSISQITRTNFILCQVAKKMRKYVNQTRKVLFFLYGVFCHKSCKKVLFVLIFHNNPSHWYYSVPDVELQLLSWYPKFPSNEIFKDLYSFDKLDARRTLQIT